MLGSYFYGFSKTTSIFYMSLSTLVKIKSWL